MVFYPEDINELDSYADWELELSLRYAVQNARQNERALRSPPPTDRADSVCGDDSESSSEPDTTAVDAEQHSECNEKRGFWATLNHEYEVNKHQALNKTYDECHEFLRNRPMSKETRHLLELGLHPFIVDDDEQDKFASREHIPREERRAIRREKAGKMRTDRINELEDPLVRAKFVGLRWDLPLERLQPKAAWLQEQAAREKEPEAVKHERLRLQNKQRVLNKAHNFHDRRIDPHHKPCLAAYSKLDFAKLGRLKPWCAKKVRFDDVHEASKLRWVDVEHVEELAQPDQIMYSNAF